MTKSGLPTDVLCKANFSETQEHAWRLDDVEDTIKKAAGAKLLCLGGQAQFRLGRGTYEMYWIDIEVSERQSDESWESYVIRGANECLEKFRKLRDSFDFNAEARHNWKDFESYNADQLNSLVKNNLYFVLYFDSENGSFTI